MTVNILGPFLVAQAMLPLIRKGGKKQVRSPMEILKGLSSMSAICANSLVACPVITH